MRLSTMKRHALIALMTLHIAVQNVPATAAVWSEIRDLPLAEFSDEDRALVRASIKDALERQPDGATLDWINPKTESSGSITPINTFKESGMKCRRTRIVNRAAWNVNDTTFVFCRLADGTWKIAR